MGGLGVLHKPCGFNLSQAVLAGAVAFICESEVASTG